MGLHARMEAQSVFNDAIQEGIWMFMYVHLLICKYVPVYERSSMFTDDDELGIEEWEDWELQLDWRQQKAAQVDAWTGPSMGIRFPLQ